MVCVGNKCYLSLSEPIKFWLMLAFRPVSVSEPGHCEELQECSNVWGNVDWFALKIALLGLMSYVHEPAVCHLPFHLIHSFKNLSLEKILLPKLTLKEKQKKNTERCPTPHFSLLKGHLTFENSPFLLSEGLSIGRAAHVCLGIRDFCAEEKCENC